MNDRFGRLLSVTTGLTFVLVLLGLYTGATGGGLSCGTRWPLCNGFLGLFPADWASFFEWFHRLVAMVVGFLLLGVLYGAWRWQSDERVKYAVTGALAVLPFQILLGGVTTTAGGLFPRGFNPVVMFGHFTVATVIFALLCYATALTRDAVDPEAVPRFAGLGVALVLAHATFDFLAVLSYPPANQMGYYAGSYALLALLVGLLVWVDESVRPAMRTRFRALVTATTVLLYVDMVLSRKLFGVADVVGEATTILLLALVVGLAVLATRSVPAAAAGRSQRAD